MDYDKIVKDFENNISLEEISKKHKITLPSLKHKLVESGLLIETVKTIKKPTEGMFVKGTSTLVDSEGNVKLQWIKLNKNEEDLFELMEKSISEITKDIKPVKQIRSPLSKTLNKDLLTNYIVTDTHLGMLAYAPETSKKVNTKIVYDNTLNALRLLIDRSVKSEVCIISDLGDELHSSDDKNRTNSGHVLDVDGRHVEIFSLAVKLKIEMIELALKKHKKVIYISVPGNHSEMVNVYLKAVLQAKFEGNKRLEIRCSPSIHQYHQFGKVLIGYTHTHTSKAIKLPEVMIADNMDIISTTKFRYYHCGHHHSASLVDNSLCLVEHHRNLTNNDVWSQGMGFRTDKQMKSITYHKEYGEYLRNTVSLVEVEEYIKKNL